jgi:NTE family protein
MIASFAIICVGMILGMAMVRVWDEASRAVARFEDLEVSFQCVAACIEDASGRWFTTGDLADPVVASWARRRRGAADP